MVFSVLNGKDDDDGDVSKYGRLRIVCFIYINFFNNYDLGVTIFIL